MAAAYKKKMQTDQFQQKTKKSIYKNQLVKKLQQKNRMMMTNKA
jgi:hypothetical protein